MNRSIRHTFLAATTACGLWLAPATAQTTATTDPVGAMTVTVNASSDTYFGVPVHNDLLIESQISGAAGNTVTADLVLSSGELTETPSFLLFTSGGLKGQWFSVTANNSDTITLDTGMDFGNSVVGDSFEVRAFWTLGALFPRSSFPNSSNPFDPDFILSTYDPSDVGINNSTNMTFAYHDGSITGQTGWFDINDPFGTIYDNYPLSPETYLVFRNLTSSAAELNFTGEVLVKDFSMLIMEQTNGQQDNRVYNPLPVPATLNELNLISGGVVAVSENPFDPRDIVFIYDFSGSGFNRSSSQAVAYHDGSVTGATGWFDINNPFGGAIGDSVSIPAGGAFVVRKAQSGVDNSLVWDISPTF